MINILRLNCNLKNSILINTKSFTFKFSKFKKNLGPLKGRISFKEVKDKIDNIITVYNEQKSILQNDQKFLVENVIFLKDPHKSLLPQLAEMLVYTHNSMTANEKTLENSNKTQIIPKPKLTVFYAFKEILKHKIKNNSINLNDITEVVKTLNKSSDTPTKFYYTLGEVVDAYFEQLIKLKDDRFCLSYIERNLKNLQLVVELPLCKSKVGNLINNILMEELKKQKRLKISNDLANFLLSFYYEYDNEVYLNYIMLNEKTNIDENNIEAIFETNLFKFKELFSKENYKNLEKLSLSQIDLLDSKLSLLVEKMYLKMNAIEQINKLYKKLISLEKLNSYMLIYFPKFIDATNKVVKDYTDRNSNLSYKDYFTNIKFILEFYAKNYLMFSEYSLTQDENLIKIFEDLKKILFNQLNLMKDYKLRWESLDPWQVEFIFTNLNFLYNCTNNNIRNEAIDTFMLNNFTRKVALNVNKDTFPFVSLHSIVYKIAQIYLSFSNESIFIDSFLSIGVEKKEADKYILECCHIISNCVYNGYKDDEKTEKLVKKLIGLVKMYGLKEDRYLDKLNELNYLLQFERPEMYKNYEEFFKELENYVGEEKNKDIWFSRNKFLNKKITKELLVTQYEKVEINPKINSVFNSDLLIKDTYFDLIGDKQFSQGEMKEYTTKYKFKISYFEKNKLKLVPVPFVDLANDLSILNKFI